ncbi:DUF1648 domain-containing protein [Streptomyces sp. NPDC050703]|uniref:DUF1648 domain-containing protein n=1 Tax=Streptomyces sp. NPDC050703 TaxID=3157218 RepID=UPI00342AF67C
MNERKRRVGVATWSAAGWSAGVLLLLAGAPLAARGRLPERVATHWGAGGEPDGSMPLWAAAVLPALIWAVLVAVAAVARLRADDRTGAAARGWTGATLLSAGVFLMGGQAAVVRANVDREHWREAGSVSGWIVAALVAAVTIGLAARLMTRRDTAAGEQAAPGPELKIPAGQRVVWFSRASNRWLHLMSLVTGLPAVAAGVAAAAGLTRPHWSLIVPLGLASLAVLCCSSVRARVSDRGLEVSLGPFGRPTRRWAPEDIESARAENRAPAQVGGWGYRLNGLGTTVMLRGGECLVVRAKGKDFAVSVDDAERGAALLNSLTARAAS